METIYRIENSAGDGPFVGVDATAWYDVTRSRAFPYSRHHPGPVTGDEGGLTEDGTPLREFYKKHAETPEADPMRFGFESLDQLQKWFGCPKGRKAMQREAGMFVSEIQVPPEHILRGNHQVAFDNREAKRVRKLDIATLQPLH